MLLSLFVLMLLVALGLAFAFAMDGVIPIPLHKIANFPFRNMPSTNGLLFGLVLAACLALFGWLMGPGAAF